MAKKVVKKVAKAVKKVVRATAPKATEKRFYVSAEKYARAVKLAGGKYKTVEEAYIALGGKIAEVGYTEV